MDWLSRSVERGSLGGNDTTRSDVAPGTNENDGDGERRREGPSRRAPVHATMQPGNSPSSDREDGGVVPPAQELA